MNKYKITVSTKAREQLLHHTAFIAKVSKDAAKSKAKASKYFNHDHTHTSLLGAQMNARSVAKGLRDIQSPLAKYLKAK